MKAMKRAALAVFVAALGASPAAGAPDVPPTWRVHFRAGKALDVASVEPADPAARTLAMNLPAGGRVVVLASAVRRLEPLPLPPTSNADELVATGDLLEPASCDPQSDPRLRRWDELVLAAASRYDLDAGLVRSVIAVESCGDADAVSPKGAVGLMQLMPRTAAQYGCTNPADPASNVEAGCQHLARLLDRLDGDLDLVLAAYNAGEGAVRKAGGIPRYPETQRYVRLVNDHLARLRESGS
jgi:soluble lytic murein transglycosylase-like protein